MLCFSLAQRGYADSTSGSGSKPQKISESKPAGLEYEKAKQAFLDGEFEALSKELEAFRLAFPKHEKKDSIIMSKFLGVIYAAHPNSREKAKFWFYRLVQVDEGADLLDLFVSEDVQNLFDKVRQEFAMRRGYRGVNDLQMRKQGESGAPPSTKSGADTVIVKDTLVVRENTGVITEAGALVGSAIGGQVRLFREL